MCEARDGAEGTLNMWLRVLGEKRNIKKNRAQEKEIKYARVCIKSDH
jgi:hypothetical protein